MEIPDQRSDRSTKRCSLRSGRHLAADTYKLRTVIDINFPKEGSDG